MGQGPTEFCCPFCYSLQKCNVDEEESKRHKQFFGSEDRWLIFARHRTRRSQNCGRPFETLEFPKEQFEAMRSEIKSLEATIAALTATNQRQAARIEEMENDQTEQSAVCE